MEIYKLHQQPPRPIGAYRNWFVNLAIPYLGFVEPLPAPKIGERFTIWDRVDVDLHKVLTCPRLHPLTRASR